MSNFHSITPYGSKVCHGSVTGVTCDTTVVGCDIRVPDSCGQCALACYSCNRPEVGSWTSCNLSPWVAAQWLTCCHQWEAWVTDGWRVEWREAEQQRVMSV